MTRRDVEAAIEQLIELLDGLDDDVDLECPADDEFSSGWQNEGSQDSLHFGDDCREPDLGFAGIATGWQGEECDDREGGDELEPNGDEGDFDGGEHDCPGFIFGGNEDGGPSRVFGNPLAEMGAAQFDGSGRLEARKALRQLRSRKVVRELLQSCIGAGA